MFKDIIQKNDSHKISKVNMLKKLTSKKNQSETIKANNSIVEEIYKILRTNLQYSSTNSNLKVIQITSANMGEGKSTVSYNLSKSLALANKKVLLIDCDLRRPLVHKLFNISNVNGLTDMLIYDAPVDNYIKKTNFKNLYILNCGVIPPNPPELLSSVKMTESINNLKNKFDIIILDSPPILPVTDSQILSRLADGTILVTCYDKTDKSSILKSKYLIENVGGKFIGSIFNKCPLSQKHYYY